MNGQQHDLLALIQQNAWEIGDAVTRILALLGGVTDTWAFPVGSVKFPVSDWYCAQRHTWSKGTPAGHTGLDLNGDKSPWGNVDLGEPVFAVADGTVHEVGYSTGWGCNVVLLIRHAGEPLWVRYAHLGQASIAAKAGNAVLAGDKLGGIGPHPNGAHLHFDMALDPFGWSYYRTAWVRWVDPLPILRAHLGAAQVDEMLRKR